MRIDLHTHSSVSDGTRPPAEVMRRAAAAGLDVVALTDHDTTRGWDEARAALPPGLRFVPGVELSCELDGRSLHLLAYLFDPDDPELNAELARLQESRDRRGREMVERLRELGSSVTLGQVERIAGGARIGRPHLARAMVEAGTVASFEEAFTADWIGADGRANVARYALDPVRAVRLVRAAGGVSVLAHPRVERGGAFDDAVIRRLAGAGLDGVEVDHPGHEPADRAALRVLVAELGLVGTGSSDDHGELSGDRIGCETTAPEAFRRLVARAGGAR
ncbi:PHP domain-containing protein [Actinomadura logoneensis]|uniref:PHP domain-containing protein n=1 Tax=Actinomadura logoneensis TaxID=2293572 RepID=A0A372JNT3_9ACTN|nr:PHP domain-containing protein [Actinomadura logoneensis]RFU41691.1 PHP domain-containing protein [Actinomadura logoneensis]